eukprot:COSAG02_NODE_7013_length_3227_cov_16.960038_2_plen_29_part_01
MLRPHTADLPPSGRGKMRDASKGPENMPA